ncbi:hypothetical protein NIASO_09755 [Niabella soli DSM 19437]|uniref:Uncharacterized protein n=1 Tax=Niabella soli DSM 19437 TaxID=929713 RepID=W0F7X0_9BACT|nr:hypothetical protein NIASO_09755 [Niabella soli DSM 19437]
MHGIWPEFYTFNKNDPIEVLQQLRISAEMQSVRKTGP